MGRLRRDLIVWRQLAGNLSKAGFSWNCSHFAALSAFRIVDAPIRAARNKDVRRQWVVFGFHCRKLVSPQSFQCILKARRKHNCSSEHIRYWKKGEPAAEAHGERRFLRKLSALPRAGFRRV
jgi:hypothetical protein